MLSATHSCQEFVQVSMTDEPIIVSIHLLENSQKLLFLSFPLMFENLTKVIKVQFGCSLRPVFIDCSLGRISTSLLKG